MYRRRGGGGVGDGGGGIRDPRPRCVGGNSARHDGLFRERPSCVGGNSARHDGWRGFGVRPPGGRVGLHKPNSSHTGSSCVNCTDGGRFLREDLGKPCWATREVLSKPPKIVQKGVDYAREAHTFVGGVAQGLL